MIPYSKRSRADQIFATLKAIVHILLLLLGFQMAALAGDGERNNKSKNTTYKGVVLDQYGHAIPGVRITSLEGSVEAFTDFDGKFVLESADDVMLFNLPGGEMLSQQLKPQSSDMPEINQVVMPSFL